MKVEKKLSFAVNDIEMLEELDDLRFAKIRIKAFASGNNTHKMPVSKETLKKTANTILRQPILYKYNMFKTDASGHSKNAIPCGYVDREDSDIQFEEGEDGRLWLCVTALIWKKFSGKILDFFEREDGKKAVSVDMLAFETQDTDEGEELLDFAYVGITILGEAHNPAVKDAEAEVIQFSEEFESDWSKFETLKFEESNNTSADANLNANFSDKDSEYKEEKGEVDMFDKNEYLKQFGLTADNMKELIRLVLKDETYMQGEYEYSKYGIWDFDADYAYGYDYEEYIPVAIPYTYVDGEISVDLENKGSYIMVPVFVSIEDKDEDVYGYEVAKKMSSIMLEEKKDQKEEDDVEEMAEDSKEDSQEEEMEEKEEKAEEGKDEEMAEDSKEDVKEEEMAEEDDSKSEFEDKKDVEMEDLKDKLEKANLRIQEFENAESERLEAEKNARIEFAIESESKFLSKDRLNELRKEAEELKFEELNGWVNSLKAESRDAIVKKGIDVKSKSHTRMASAKFEEEKNIKKSRSMWDLTY